MKLKNAILITGAGQRIGAYLAKQFLRHTDYPVIFTYRTHRQAVDDLIALGAVGIQADFTKPSQVQALIDQITNQACSLRAVIHNASLWLDDAVANSFEDQWRVHVETPYRINEAVYDLLMASGDVMKDIISLSDASVGRGHAKQVGYFASKAALQEMTYAYAKKYSPSIKVNDIAPALIMFNDWDDEQYKTKRLQESVIPIEPGAEVIWQAVMYLMNSPYTTGTVLPVDGGRRLR